MTEDSENKWCRPFHSAGRRGARHVDVRSWLMMVATSRGVVRLRRAIAHQRQECDEIGGATDGGLMDTSHINRVVGVRHDMAETGGAYETLSQGGVKDAAFLQQPERVRVCRGGHRHHRVCAGQRETSR